MVESTCPIPFSRWDANVKDMSITVIEEGVKFCPRCGGKLHQELSAGRLRPVCHECGLVFYTNIKVGAGVLVERGGQVLLIRRAIPPGLGQWCLPSGFVEDDESPEEAAIRECQEETGLEVVLKGLLGVYHYRHNSRGSGVLILYGADIQRGELVAGDDAIEVGFFSPENLPPIAFRTHRQALEEWLQRVGR